MFIFNTIEKIKLYLSSIFFPISIAVIAFLCWIIPSPFNWITVSIYIIMMFLPLLAKDGKPYITLLSFIFVSTSKDLSFVNIPPETITLAVILLASMIAFLFINKLPFVKGDLLLPLLFLIGTLFISYLYNSIENSSLLNKSAFYLLCFFICIITYTLFATILGKVECLPYLSKSLAILSFLIYLELISHFIQKGYTYGDLNLSLGWAHNGDMICLFLMSIIPFLLLLIFQGQYFYYAPLFLNILFTLLISSNVGILLILLFIIPIVIIAFRSNRRIYPYMPIFLLSAFFVTFILLISFNSTFNNRILSSIKTLLLFKEEDETLKVAFENAANQIKSNPYVGKSISYYVYNDNYHIFSSNTYLTIMTLGGVLSLICFIYVNIRVYYFCLRKNADEKYLFLLFLLMFEFAGLFTNTIFNIQFLCFFLLCNCVYQMSNRPSDILVHSDYIQPNYYN